MPADPPVVPLLRLVDLHPLVPTTTPAPVLVSWLEPQIPPLRVLPILRRAQHPLILLTTQLRAVTALVPYCPSIRIIGPPTVGWPQLRALADLVPQLSGGPLVLPAHAACEVRDA